MGRRCTCWPHVASESRGFEKAHRLEAAAQDLPRISPEVDIEDLLVHGPEVDGVGQIAVAVELAQIRLPSVAATSNGIADQEQRRRRAVLRQLCVEAAD